MKKLVNLIPVHKMAESIEVAEYIYFLCLFKNNQISNEVLNISSGE